MESLIAVSTVENPFKVLVETETAKENDRRFLRPCCDENIFK